MDFKSQLKKLRNDKDLTQTELGKILNLSKQAISSYENGVSFPPQDILNKIADYFKVTVDYLLGRSDIKNPDQLLTPDQELAALLNDPALKVAFQDYASWTDEDKRELINYLKVKKMARENKDK